MAKQQFKMTKQTQQILIGVVILIVVIYLYKKFKKPTDQTTTETKTTATGSTSGGGAPVIPVDYGNVTVKYGSSGEAVKLTQLRLNSLIDLCKAAYNSQKTYPNMSSTTINRINKIALWDKLVVDGKFGSKTKALVVYVMGTDSTTLNKVREKYNNFETLINS